MLREPEDDYVKSNTLLILEQTPLGITPFKDNTF